MHMGSHRKRNRKFLQDLERRAGRRVDDLLGEIRSQAEGQSEWADPLGDLHRDLEGGLPDLPLDEPPSLEEMERHLADEVAEDVRGGSEALRERMRRGMEDGSQANR